MMQSLEEIMQHMRDVHQFTPSKRAFQTQFKRWGFPSKRKPTFRDEDLLDRVKELWEANYSQRAMLDTLQAEGHDIKERELMRLRAKNRWLMRIPNGAKMPAVGDDTDVQLEAQLLQAAAAHAAVEAGLAVADQENQALTSPQQPQPPQTSDDPPQEFLERQRERLEMLKEDSDRRWAEK
jgi:hypothetical protein